MAPKLRCLAALIALLAGGCAANLTGQLADDLASAILNQNDPETVRDGAPAYLLLIDGLIENDSDNPRLLLAGSRLYASYAAAFVDNPQRAQRLSSKARAYARRALCQHRPGFCEAEQGAYQAFVPVLGELSRADLAALYTYATAWAAWIQSRSGDWSAVADLPKVEAMLERILALDEGYEMGQAHLYLGAIRSLRPPALGGQPEKGRAHFERAIELSNEKNLYAKLEFARRYARIVYDRALHDRLLNEVLQADPEATGLTLGNVIAQQQARQLLADADDYFFD